MPQAGSVLHEEKPRPVVAVPGFEQVLADEPLSFDRDAVDLATLATVAEVVETLAAYPRLIGCPQESHPRARHTIHLRL